MVPSRLLDLAVHVLEVMLLGWPPCDTRLDWSNVQCWNDQTNACSHLFLPVLWSIHLSKSYQILVFKLHVIYIYILLFVLLLCYLVLPYVTICYNRIWDDCFSWCVETTKQHVTALRCAQEEQRCGSEFHPCQFFRRISETLAMHQPKLSVVNQC